MKNKYNNNFSLLLLIGSYFNDDGDVIFILFEKNSVKRK